jgi:hypothetical protein
MRPSFTSSRAAPAASASTVVILAYAACAAPCPGAPAPAAWATSMRLSTNTHVAHLSRLCGKYLGNRPARSPRMQRAVQPPASACLAVPPHQVLDQVGNYLQAGWHGPWVTGCWCAQRRWRTQLWRNTSQIHQRKGRWLDAIMPLATPAACSIAMHSTADSTPQHAQHPQHRSLAHSAHLLSAGLATWRMAERPPSLAGGPQGWHARAWTASQCAGSQCRSAQHRQAAALGGCRCAVLFCAVLFCSVLFCSVLCCSVLFCAVLFCSVLCCAVLCAAKW